METFKINPDEYNITLFSKHLRDYHSNIQPVKSFNGNREWTRETKCLGVILDSKLTHKAHIS